MTGRENLNFSRRTSSAQVIVTMRPMGGPHAGRSPARRTPCRIFRQGRLWPWKIEFFHTIDVNRPFERRSSSLARTRLNSKRMHAET